MGLEDKMLFPDIFEKYVEEAEQKISVELAKVLEEKPDLAFKDIMTYVIDIGIYSYYFPEKKEEDSSLFDKLLDIYDYKLSDEERFAILLRIEDRNSFKRFALKHYDYFKESLARCVFIPANLVGDTDFLDDFQFRVDRLFKGLNYKVQWWYLDNSIEIYKMFGDEIKFLDGRKLVKYFVNQLYCIKEDELEELFNYEISQNNPKNIGEFLGAFSSRKMVENNSILKTSLDSKTKIERTLEAVKEQFDNRYAFFDIETRSSFSKIYSNILRENIGKKDEIDINQLDSIFSVSYLRALNELESYSKEELAGSSLYLKCFKLFIEEFKKNYGGELRDDLLIIVETLFKRVIKRKDIFVMLSIKNEKSLWHFYKTDEFVNTFNISLDTIKRCNTKQYNFLKKKYIEYRTRNIDEGELFKREIFDFEETNMIIGLLDILGFDITNKLIYEEKYDLVVLLKYFENKSEDYIKAIKKVLGNGFGNILKTYNANINTFLACFDVLYEQKCPNITINRMVKSLGSLSYVLFPSNFHIGGDLEKLSLAKGEPLLEKIEGIKLFDKYRFRRDSSIPDIRGHYKDCDYQMVDLHSSEILSNGIGNYLLPNNTKASSCLTPNGKAASCLRHGALNPNWRFFKVEHNGKIIAYSWVWRVGDVICFDNIEVTDELLKVKDYEKILFDVYIKTTEELMKITGKVEVRGVKLVTLGRNEIDLANNYFDSLEEVPKKQRELFKPNGDEEIYLKDSSNKQLILGGDINDDIQIEDVKPIYKYQRPKVMNFSELNNEEVTRKINAIYFDYCLENNKKYQSLRNIYGGGYLGEDWFVGEKDNNRLDFYFRGDDERLFLEAKDYVDGIEKPLYEVDIIHPEKELIENILNAKNIEVDYEKLGKYLDRTKREQFVLLSEYYTHYPGDLKNFANILENKAITSSEYGKHSGGDGCNGKHFISVAQVNSEAYDIYLNPPTFIITSDICTFSNKVKAVNLINDSFENSSYPFRNTNYVGEYHVLNSITMDKVKAIFASTYDISDLVKIIYLQDLFENRLPLVEIADNSYIDKEVIKRYCKIKN